LRLRYTASAARRPESRRRRRRLADAHKSAAAARQKKSAAAARRERRRALAWVGLFRKIKLKLYDKWLHSRLDAELLRYKNYCKKLSSLKRFLRTTSATRRSKTANITKKDDITLQHIAKMSLCSEVISSFCDICC